MARHRLAAFLSTLIIFGVIAPGTVHGGEEEQFLHRSADEAVELLIDTDMGLDDVRAIFALLADTLIDIHCIVTVEGSASIGKGLDNLI
ncbi:MAG: hypothetical protein KAX38_07120, partial [Candidatus Krumholzibacteria bacterium]|nr:hypothetical protein [Candidatus Krumholzibacteria bacterium]